MSAVLLVQTRAGETVAVRFPSLESARAWEDDHLAELDVTGAARVVSKTEALAQS